MQSSFSLCTWVHTYQTLAGIQFQKVTRLIRRKGEGRGRLMKCCVPVKTREVKRETNKKKLYSQQEPATSENSNFYLWVPKTKTCHTRTPANKTSSIVHIWKTRECATFKKKHKTGHCTYFNLRRGSVSSVCQKLHGQFVFQSLSAQAYQVYNARNLMEPSAICCWLTIVYKPTLWTDSICSKEF